MSDEADMPRLTVRDGMVHFSPTVTNGILMRVDPEPPDEVVDRLKALPGWREDADVTIVSRAGQLTWVPVGETCS